MQNTGGLKLSGVKRQSTKDIPLISILTVVFNGEKTIERTIKSVLEQTYSNIEYIVIDAESTDGTMDVITKHAGDIDLFISEPDGGIYDAMNKGLALCTGEIIGIVNSDDWYEPTTVSEIVKAYKDCNDCVQHGLLRIHDDEGEVEIQSFYASRLPNHMLTHPTCFVPRTLYETYGLFNLNYKFAADYDLMIRLFTRGVKFNCIHSVLSNFTRGGAMQSNDYTSTIEVITIRYKHGLISEKQYKKTLIKAKITASIQKLKKLARTVYTKLNNRNQYS